MGLLSTMMESIATLKRPTIGRDSADGVTQDPFVTLLENIPCSVGQMSARQMELYAQRNVQVDATLYTLYDLGAEVNDKFEVTGRDNVTRTFLVQSVFGGDPRGRGPWSLGVIQIRQPETYVTPTVMS